MPRRRIGRSLFAAGLLATAPEAFALPEAWPRPAVRPGDPTVTADPVPMPQPRVGPPPPSARGVRATMGRPPTGETR